MSNNFNNKRIEGHVLTEGEHTDLIQQAAGVGRRRFAASVEEAVLAKIKHKQHLGEDMSKNPVPLLSDAMMDSIAKIFENGPTMSVQRQVEATVHLLYLDLLAVKNQEIESLKKDLDTMRAKNNELNAELDSVRTELGLKNNSLKIAKQKIENLHMHSEGFRAEAATQQQRSMRMKEDLRSVVNERDILIKQIEKLKSETALASKEFSLKIATETDPNGNRYLRINCGGEVVTFLL